MEHKPFDYCLILGGNLESLLYLERTAKKEGNAVFCYYFYDRNGNQCAFPLASALFENGDFTILRHLFVSRPIIIDSDFENQVVQIHNAACDKLFANKISEIERKYMLSPKEIISSFMQQMGFPAECVDEYQNEGTIYLYDGFYREKITKIAFPKIQSAIDNLHGAVYAVILDHFSNTYCYLIWDANVRPKQLTPLTNDNRFGKTSLLRCVIDKADDDRKEYFYIGVMTNAGGVWSVPNDIASMKSYRYKFDNFRNLE